EFPKRVRYGVSRHWVETLAIVGPQAGKSDPTKPHCLVEHRIEHGREVAGRGIDYAQDLGRGGLLLQGLAGLSNQSRVLHRDDSLRREVLQKRKLFLCKGPHFASIDRDPAEQLLVFAERHANTATRAQACQRRRATWPLQHVYIEHHSLAGNDTLRNRPRRWFERLP